MSFCRGTGSRHFRLSGEFYDKEDIDFGSGAFGIRIRCADDSHGCASGKVGIIGSDFLSLLGIAIPDDPDDLICAFSDEPIIIEIDLI